MKAIISKEVVDNCCELCTAFCYKEGKCPCDHFREENDKDPRVADCGDVYFVEGDGVEYIGF